jgi:hypothetical protein
MVMATSVHPRRLRWRRRRYALSAQRRRAWSGWPEPIVLPGGWLLERTGHLGWRRLVLWLVLVPAGWLGLAWLGQGWAGGLLGAAAAIAAELASSYRWRGRKLLVPEVEHGQGPAGLAGVREPRRPHPAGDAGAASLPPDPPPPPTG